MGFKRMIEGTAEGELSEKIGALNLKMSELQCLFPQMSDMGIERFLKRRGIRVIREREKIDVTNRNSAEIRRLIEEGIQSGIIKPSERAKEILNSTKKDEKFKKFIERLQPENQIPYYGTFDKTEEHTKSRKREKDISER